MCFNPTSNTAVEYQLTGSTGGGLALGHYRITTHCTGSRCRKWRLYDIVPKAEEKTLIELFYFKKFRGKANWIKITDEIRKSYTRIYPNYDRSLSLSLSLLGIHNLT